MTNTKLRLNSVPAFIFCICVATGNKSFFRIACFVCLCKDILILRQHLNVCIQNCKVLFSLLVPLPFMHVLALFFLLLCFCYYSCNECTSEQHGVFTASFFVSWSCLRATRERTEEGGISKREQQWLPG